MRIKDVISDWTKRLRAKQDLNQSISVERSGILKRKCVGN